ncbi:MAG: DUF421 domain-containing protein [Actinobacteria bacterium]|nr:MAG: DUF421 domain-containing protein [Actinomycetota bacterium]
MIPVARALAMYLFLLVLVRVSGKRTLAEVTVFDFILLLIISECTQQAMTGNDFSVTNGFLLVLTLVTVDRLSDWVTSRSERIDQVVSDAPLVLVDEGRVLHDRLKASHMRVDEILEAARTDQGLERLDQIKYAVLERSGGISVIPSKDD